MMNFKEIEVATDNDFVYVTDKDNHIVAKGNWYQDNVLPYITASGRAKPGYKFNVKVSE